MIARFKPVRRSWSVVAVALAAVFGVVSLTNATDRTKLKTNTTVGKPAKRPTSGGRPRSLDALAVQLRRLKAQADSTIAIRAAEVELKKKLIEAEETTRAVKAGAPKHTAQLAEMEVGMAQLMVEYAKFNQSQDRLRYEEAKCELASLQRGRAAGAGRPPECDAIALRRLKAQVETTIRIRAHELMLRRKLIELRRVLLAHKRGLATATETRRAEFDVSMAELSLEMAKFTQSQYKLEYEEAKKLAELRTRDAPEVVAIRLRRLKAEAENTIAIRAAEVELKKKLLDAEEALEMFKKGAAPKSPADQAQLDVAQAQLKLEQAKFERAQAQLRYEQARREAASRKP